MTDKNTDLNYIINDKNAELESVLVKIAGDTVQLMQFDDQTHQLRSFTLTVQMFEDLISTYKQIEK